MPTWRGAHRGKLCPPTAHPPWSEGAGSGHRSLPFPRAGVWLGGNVPSLSSWHLLTRGHILLRSHPLLGREQDPGGTRDGGDRQPLRNLPAGVSPAGVGCCNPPSPAVICEPSPDPPLPPCRFYSPEGEREPRGRCLPCAAAPRSTPGCPGGCSGCRLPRGRCRMCSLLKMRRDVLPGTWQLRMSPLVTWVASASLGANPAVGLLGKMGFNPNKHLSKADPVPPPRPATNP